MRTIAAFLAILSAGSGIAADAVPAKASVLGRRYQEGENLTYRMEGSNEDWRYEIRAKGVVKKAHDGGYVEEYAWSDLISNGSRFALPPASVAFRQILSLEPGKPPEIPRLAGVHAMLIGPITDFLTFYVDLWLANRVAKLSAAGDHVYHESRTPGSWADGSRVVLGESSVDFDITLADVNASSKVATLVVRHVPPKQPRVRLPASWMRQPIAETPNNWVNVVREGDTYIAAVGTETFNVTIKVDLADGKILSGAMENQVKARERVCVEAALTNCGDSRPREILRQIKVSLER